jgi:hypothetical protein
LKLVTEKNGEALASLAGTYFFFFLAALAFFFVAMRVSSFLNPLP